ncbi:hypothetical protein SLEP1_g59842 [Rubroshorea leprosula]|uniref:Uncharacterized protein n=1 Tax=Rubroshorea leprosula TaxID=152421 RepID=A0AAV5MTJ6_9ROSI|nr:hypothetical protein SLEP1_g59842 [Rubroshorea leprosula]
MAGRTKAIPTEAETVGVREFFIWFFFWGDTFLKGLSRSKPRRPHPLGRLLSNGKEEYSKPARAELVVGVVLLPVGPPSEDWSQSKYVGSYYKYAVLSDAGSTDNASSPPFDPAGAVERVEIPVIHTSHSIFILVYLHPSLRALSHMDSSMCSSAPDPEMWIIQGTLAWRTSPVRTGV